MRASLKSRGGCARSLGVGASVSRIENRERRGWSGPQREGGKNPISVSLNRRGEERKPEFSLILIHCGFALHSCATRVMVLPGTQDTCWASSAGNLRVRGGIVGRGSWIVDRGSRIMNHESFSSSPGDWMQAGEIAKFARLPRDERSGIRVPRWLCVR